MNAHLHRALIEVYYAIAEFRPSHAAGSAADTRALLFFVKANLEELLLDQAAVEPDDGKLSRAPHSNDNKACRPPFGAEPPD